MDGMHGKRGMRHIETTWMVILIVFLSWHQPASAGQTSGRDIYNFRCYFCHGYSGTAQTLAAEMLSPAPRDFTATAVNELSSDEMVAAVRENGVPVEYIVFDDEGHGFRNRSNRIEAAEAYLSFLDEHLGGPMMPEVDPDADV